MNFFRDDTSGFKKYFIKSLIINIRIDSVPMYGAKVQSISDLAVLLKIDELSSDINVT